MTKGEQRRSWKLKLFWVLVVYCMVATLVVVFPLVVVLADTQLNRDVVANGSRGPPAGLEIPWQGTDGTFDWHPLMMTLGFVVIMTQSVLSFRTVSRIPGLNLGKTGQKAVHVTLHAVELILISVGTAAILKHMSHENNPQFASMHSWLGLLTLLSFVSVILMGCVLYLTPRSVVSEARRKAASHYHRFAGLTVYLLSFATLATGVMDAMPRQDFKYPRDAAARTAQALGILLPFIAIPVVFIVTKPEYRRRLPQDEATHINSAPDAEQRESLRGSGAVRSVSFRKTEDGNDLHKILLSETH